MTNDVRSIIIIMILFNQSPAAAALITEKDVDGFTPVHYAARRGDVKVMLLL